MSVYILPSHFYTNSRTINWIQGCVVITSWALIGCFPALFLLLVAEVLTLKIHRNDFQPCLKQSERLWASQNEPATGNRDCNCVYVGLIPQSYDGVLIHWSKSAGSFGFVKLQGACLLWSCSSPQPSIYFRPYFHQLPWTDIQPPGEYLAWTALHWPSDLFTLLTWTVL